MLLKHENIDGRLLPIAKEKARKISKTYPKDKVIYGNATESFNQAPKRGYVEKENRDGFERVR